MTGNSQASPTMSQRAQFRQDRTRFVQVCFGAGFVLGLVAASECMAWSGLFGKACVPASGLKGLVIGLLGIAGVATPVVWSIRSILRADEFLRQVYATAWQYAAWIGIAVACLLGLVEMVVPGLDVPVILVAGLIPIAFVAGLLIEQQRRGWFDVDPCDPEIRPEVQP